MSTEESLAPEWLLSAQIGLCSCTPSGRRSKQGFLNKTVAGLSGVVRRALQADDLAHTDGLLQRLDPRTKIVTLLGVLVVSAFVRHTPVLLAMWVLTLLVAMASAIPGRSFAARVWLTVPLFTGIVVLPATLNLVTAGEIVIPLRTWFGHPVGITRQGLGAATLIVSRVAVSMSLVMLLTMTTAWNRVLAALRSLRLPRVFVLVIGMTYRYVFHLLDTVDEMYVARRARTVTTDRNPDLGREVVAATAGSLFGKSYALADEVHQAMTARGWTGNARTLRTERMSWRDAAWVAVCVSIGLAVVVADRALGR